MKKIFILCCVVLIVFSCLLTDKASPVECFTDGKKVDAFSVSPYYDLYDLLLMSDNVVKVTTDIGQNGQTDSFTVLKSYKGIFAENQPIDNVIPYENIVFDKNGNLVSYHKVVFEQGGEYLFFLSDNNPFDKEYHHAFPDAILDIKTMKAATKYGDKLFSKYSRFASLEKAIKDFDRQGVIFVDRLSDHRFAMVTEPKLRQLVPATPVKITEVLSRDFTYNGTELTAYHVFFTDENQNEYVTALDTRPDIGDARAYMYSEDGHVFGTLFQ